MKGKKLFVRMGIFVFLTMFGCFLFGFGCEGGGQEAPLPPDKGPPIVPITKCTGSANTPIDVQCSTDNASTAHQQCLDFDKNKNNNQLSAGQTGAYQCVNKCYCTFIKDAPPPPAAPPVAPTAWKGVKQLGTASDEIVEGMTTDEFGNVYVVGTTRGLLSGSKNEGGLDIFVAQFDVYGQRRWVQQIGSSANDYANAVIYNKEFLYIVGFTEGDLAVKRDVQRTDSDFLLLKYNLDGKNVWKKQFDIDNTSFYDERGNGIAIDGSNKIFVVGDVLKFGKSTSDLFITRLNAEGDIDDLKILNSDNNMSEGARGVAVGENDKIYVVGHSELGEYSGVKPSKKSGMNILLVKFTKNLDLETIKLFENGGVCVGTAIAANNVKGNILISGGVQNMVTNRVSDVAISYSMNLDLIKTLPLTPDETEGVSNSLALYGERDVFIVGNTLGKSGVNVGFIYKYDSGLLSQKWQKQIIDESQQSTNVYGKVIATDKDGNVFVAVDTNGGINGVKNTDVSYTTTDVFILKFNKDGNLQ